MSRSSGGGNGNGNGKDSGSRPSGAGRRAREHDAGAGETRSLAAFLRDLAERAERDPALAAHLREALGASGLLDAADRGRARPAAGKERARALASATSRRADRSASADADHPPDPFVLLRERGEAGLRAALEGLDLAALRAIVRGHRLDPARISARWTARERVVDLIVTQVRGRANLGKAFARV